MAGTPAARPLPGAAESTFMLQTSAIRNSAPFKSKSADIFGSLETMERNYSSAVSGRVADGGEADDDGDADEEGFIKRGCIFKKPWGSSGTGSSSHKDSAHEPGSSVTRDYQIESRGRRQHDETPKALSLGTHQPNKSGKPATSALSSVQQESTTCSSDKTQFRKPLEYGMSEDGGRDTRSSRNFGRRGGGRPNLSFAPRGKRRTPDHVLNPHKYTEYSLEETSMCGNTANRSVALGFLRELRKRKKHGEADQEAAQLSCAKGHFVFHKPSASGNAEQTEHSNKTKAYGSVYKMTEYEVGRASGPKHQKTKLVCCPGEEQDQPDDVEKSPTEPSTKSVSSLDHLQNEQPIGIKEKSKADDSAQSKMTEPAGNVDNGDQSERGSTSEGEAGFKIRKGKGRRQLRGRPEEDA